MSEKNEIICGNVLVVPNGNPDLKEEYPIRIEDFLAFTGDLTQTITLLPAAESEAVSITGEEGWEKLFGSWREAGNEDEVLEKIYHSRLVPSSRPDDE